MHQGRLSLFLNLLVVLTLGVLSMSCGPKKRPAELPSYTDTVGPFGIVYHDANDFDYPVTDEFRAEIKRRVDLVWHEYELQYSWLVTPVELRVYPGFTSGVPCGGPNGGGCYRTDDIIFVTGEVWPLFHELNHRRLLLSGDPEWINHNGKSWDKVWKFDEAHK